MDIGCLKLWHLYHFWPWVVLHGRTTWHVRSYHLKARLKKLAVRRAHKAEAKSLLVFQDHLRQFALHLDDAIRFRVVFTLRCFSLFSVPLKTARPSPTSSWRAWSLAKGQRPSVVAMMTLSELMVYHGRPVFSDFPRYMNPALLDPWRIDSIAEISTLPLVLGAERPSLIQGDNPADRCYLVELWMFQARENC